MRFRTKGKGSEFEPRPPLHQTEIELEKPSQKCGGFSVNCCNTVAIARFNSLFRTAVVLTGNTYRRYPQAPIVYIDGAAHGAERRGIFDFFTEILLPDTVEQAPI